MKYILFLLFALSAKSADTNRVTYYYTNRVTFDYGTNCVKLTLVNIESSTNDYRMDYTATNLVLRSYDHEPYIVGKTNDYWIIKFR